MQKGPAYYGWHSSLSRWSLGHIIELAWHQSSIAWAPALPPLNDGLWLEAERNAFLPKLLSVRVFYHSNRDDAWTLLSKYTQNRKSFPAWVVAPISKIVHYVCISIKKKSKIWTASLRRLSRVWDFGLKRWLEWCRAYMKPWVWPSAPHRSGVGVHIVNPRTRELEKGHVKPHIKKKEKKRECSFYRQGNWGRALCFKKE